MNEKIIFSRKRSSKRAVSTELKSMTQFLKNEYIYNKKLGRIEKNKLHGMANK